MTLVQVHFQGRGDTEPLNSATFDHRLDGDWTQYADKAFRVRFEVEETAATDSVCGGTLEASYNGGSFFPVTTTSGTVAAAASVQFADEDATTDVLNGSITGFAAGEGSEDGLAVALTLNDSHTEHEYAVRIVGDDVATGGTVALRVGGLDTYAQAPSLQVAEWSDLDKVREMIGDTDSTDPLLTDNEVRRFIADWPQNITLAAAEAAGAVSAKFARGYDFSTDGQSFNRSQRANTYALLAASLRKRAAQFSIK